MPQRTKPARSYIRRGGVVGPQAEAHSAQAAVCRHLLQRRHEARGDPQPPVRRQDGERQFGHIVGHVPEAAIVAAEHAAPVGADRLVCVFRDRPEVAAAPEAPRVAPRQPLGRVGRLGLTPACREGEHRDQECLIF